jgi:hypothetical protein
MSSKYELQLHNHGIFRKGIRPKDHREGARDRANGLVFAVHVCHRIALCVRFTID